MSRRITPRQTDGNAPVLALTGLLYGCTDERLASFTASGLASAYNVPLARVEAMLASARQGRLL